MQVVMSGCILGMCNVYHIMLLWWGKLEAWYDGKYRDWENFWKVKKCREILSLVLVPSVPLQWDYPRWRGASTEGEREGEPQQKKKFPQFQYTIWNGS